MTVDSNNTIWVGTVDNTSSGGTLEGGLQKFDGVNWITYTQKSSGLINNWILELAVDKNNNIWIGTRGGLSVYRQGR